MKILFLHGWQSVPGGVKPTYLAQHGHEVINPKLPDDDFEAAVKVAQAEFNKYQPAVVVGSSRGGAVAMNMDSGDTPLVLFCPAWKNWGTASIVKPGTVILHSRADDVVPFSDSEELAKKSGAVLLEVGNDHRLADQLLQLVPLEKLPHHLIGRNVLRRFADEAHGLLLAGPSIPAPFAVASGRYLVGHRQGDAVRELGRGRDDQ